MNFKVYCILKWPLIDCIQIQQLYKNIINSHSYIGNSLQANGPVIYTSEKEGSDESGDGTAQKPYKTVMQVLELVNCFDC